MASHLMWYWGGRGSKMGMVKARRCSGSRIIFLVSVQVSLWYTCSFSLSSTQMCHCMELPCDASRHWNVGCTVTCTRSTVLQAHSNWASSGQGYFFYVRGFYSRLSQPSTPEMQHICCMLNFGW